MRTSEPQATATFAAGCFWGVEKAFAELKGVLGTEVGYTGGDTSSPSYEEVCQGNTGHAEAVRVHFDPKTIDYAALVHYFFSIHDATQLHRQGPDIGTQYRSAIFVHTELQSAIAIQVLRDTAEVTEKPIVTEVVEAGAFYPAEDYHQKYYLK